MAISISGTTLTFNDNTTQTTAATGTVSSVATGNGLQGGTITTSGTLSVACPTFNTVGSYVFGQMNINTTVTSGADYSAGNGNQQVQSGAMNGQSQNNLSGSWRLMGPGQNVCVTTQFWTTYCRVS